MADAEDCLGGTIIAGAGAGKTTATVRLHKDFVSRGLRTVVITFTNAAVADYVSRANEDGPQVACASVDVFTFHKLASALVAEGDEGVVNDTSLDTIVALAIERVETSGVPEKFSDTRRILVDEAQDCSSENYELVRSLGRCTGASIVMIGDANQNLYRFRNADARFLLAHSQSQDRPGMFEKFLGTNWRSTPEIVSVCEPFMRHKKIARARPNALSGRVPVLHILPPKEAVSRAIAVCAESLECGQTVALIGRSKRPLFVGGRTARLGLQTIVNEMERRRVPYVRLFRESSDEGGDAESTPSLKPGAVNIMTVHGSKGLEADAVVVIDALEDRVNGSASVDCLEIMYVALSRARTRLDVFNSSFGKCDPTLFRCVDLGLCRVEGRHDPRAKPVERKSIGRLTVTGLLNDRVLLSETELLDLSRLLEISGSVKAHPRADFQDEFTALPDIGDLSALYGQLAESVIQMAWASRFGLHDRHGGPNPRRPVVIDKLDAFASARVSVPKKHEPALVTLFKVTKAKPSDTISRSDVAGLRDRISRHSQGSGYSAMGELLEYILGRMDLLGRDRVSLVLPSSTQCIPTSKLRSIVIAYNCEEFQPRRRLRSLFDACMFFHQLHTHSGYRWARDYSRHVNAFAPIADRIAGMARYLPEHCEFEQEVVFKSVRIRGRADACGPGRVIEFKFVGRLGLSHFMQPCMYALLGNSSYAKRAEVWNLASGERVNVEYASGESTRWTMFERIARWTGCEVVADDLKAVVKPPPTQSEPSPESGAPQIELSSETLGASRIVDSIDDVLPAVSHFRSTHDVTIEQVREGLEAMHVCA